MLRFFLTLSFLLAFCVRILAQDRTEIAADPEKLRYAHQMEKEAMFKKDSLLLAKSWCLLGKEYEDIGDFGRAQSHFLKALEVLEKRPPSYDLVKNFVFLSETEQRQNHMEESLAYALAARRVAHQLNSPEGLAIAYRMLGHVREFIWDGKGYGPDYDSVLFCYSQSEKLSRQIGDTLKTAEANAFLGALYLRNSPMKALPYLEESLLLFTIKHDYEWQVRVLTHLSSVYQMLNRMKLSWAKLKQAEKLYKDRKLNEHGMIAMIESRFVKYYEKTKQVDLELAHYKNLVALEMKRSIADREGAISRLRIEYEIEKKEAIMKAQNHEIALREENLRNQERFTLAMTSLFVVAAIASIIFFSLYRKNQRISLYNEDLLREQNHRVKNNLQIVSSLLNMQSKRLLDTEARKAMLEARLRIESMATLHRRLYDGSRFAKVNLDDFLREVIQGVLKSFGYGHIQPIFQIEDIFLPADKAVPIGLIVNELSTNACKYAFVFTATPELIVTCHNVKNNIRLTVSDNGPGISGAGQADDTRFQEKKKSSFGMALIRSQVIQLDGTSHLSPARSGAQPGLTFVIEFKA
ncbi:sensor histidine kinase [Dyadobacter sp. CY261]|uniref:sensor histidine kinase n=1 Tax=Dyadobacter sp. CY261 TaxID=2907203 RepID=UPI001F3ABF8A|nr:sensor histidine kinase [Dyadobacter sp. CY261]MCF0075582.1 sensor histidine kinase [Dyadobacter sp. CY261]